MRPVRGPRIAVGCWNAAPVDCVIVSAAYLLEMMEESGTKIYRLSDEERDAVREGLESPVVSEEELKAFRNRHKA